MKINEIIDNHFSDIFEKQLLNELCKYAILKNVETDKIVLEIRREIKFIPIIISGVAKVMRGFSIPPKGKLGGSTNTS